MNMLIYHCIADIIYFGFENVLILNYTSIIQWIIFLTILDFACVHRTHAFETCGPLSPSTLQCTGENVLGIDRIVYRQKLSSRCAPSGELDRRIDEELLLFKTRLLCQGNNVKLWWVIIKHNLLGYIFCYLILYG